MKKIILFILSILPICAFTNDSNFGTIESDNNELWRFSLFQFMCGDFKLYIITWNKDENKKVIFRIVKRLTIRQCYRIERQQIKEREKYRKYLKSIEEEQILVEREDLCYHIDNESGRIETSNDKINTYATIVLTVIPIVMAIVDWKNLWDNGFCTKVILCIIVYSLFNIVMYIYKYLKVDSYDRYRFAEIKILEGKKRKIWKRNVLLYKDWQNLRIDAGIKVSYVLNLQKWIALAFSIVVFLIILA